MKQILYVDAKNGSDENSGKRGHAFRSAGRAFSAAHALLSKKADVELTLRFKRGVYATSEPLTLSGESFKGDYSLTLSGERGAEIRGTYDIPARLFERVEGKEYYAYTLPTELYRDGRPPKSKAVYFNGETRDRAASDYTDTDYNEECFTDEDGREYYSIFVKEGLLSDLLGAPRESDGKPTLLCNPHMELAIVLSWYFSIARIEGIDYAHSFGSEAEGCHEGYIALRLSDPDGAHFHDNPGYVGKIGDGKHRRFRLCGNLAFLHKAGQYYYDEDAGVVYYYPRRDDDMERGIIGLALCDRLLSFTDMKNITVEGLRLCGTTSDVTAGGGCMTAQAGVIRFREEKKWCTDAAVYTKDVENLKILDCRISDTYYHGIAAEGMLNGAEIARCDFKNIGASSISIVSRPTSNPARNLVITDNYSENSGYVFNNCCGFFILHVNGLKMLYNTVIDSSYSAISVGLTWAYMYGSIDEPDANIKNAEIAYNYIENPMIRCYDGGAIYVNGGTANVKKYKTLYNSMHHNYAYCGTPHKGREKCMETSTSLYHDTGASHWHTHDNVIWADEETLSRTSYISMQCGFGDPEKGSARILVERNYIFNIKEDHLTCGRGVDPSHYVYELQTQMLYRGKCPDGFSPVPDEMTKKINGIVLGAGARGRKNARPINTSGYRCKNAGEATRFKLTAVSDQMTDKVFEQFDYNERWFGFPYAEIRRLGAKRAEDYTEYELSLFKEGMIRWAKILYSSIDTTIGLTEFGLYPDGEKLDRAIRFGQTVGCQRIRVYAGLYAEGDDPTVYYNAAKDNLRRMCDVAEREGIDLWLTVRRGTVADTAERACRLIEDVGSPNLFIAINPAEVYRSGDDVWEAFQRVRPYLACLEITDVDEKGMSVPVGGGVLPYAEMLRTLLDADYEGYLCLSPAFGRLGGKTKYPANGKTLVIDGPNSYRNRAACYALYDLMEQIGYPID